MVTNLKSSSHSVAPCDFCNRNVLEEQSIIFNKDARLLYPIRPIIAEHLIIMPVRHVAYFFELSDQEIIAMRDLMRTIFQVFKKDRNASGFNLFTNNGKSAGQQIAHVHWHVFMRFDEEKFSPYDILNGTLERENTTSTDEIWKIRKNIIIKLIQDL